MSNIKKHNAFTLVELIVVIVILAILATIAFLSFSSQSGSARDSTRLADISSIKKSVEMYNVNAGTYPTPDKSFSYTYSGGVIWNQGTIGDSAYKLLQKNLSKKVVDPLKGSEYDYSLASNKREYQVAGNFENPTSYEKSLNPFHLLSSQFSSLSSSEANALGGTGANVYISGNYNGVMLKVFTGSTYYFVPTPTLFGIGTGSTVYDNAFGSGKDLLPGVNNVAIFDSSKVYATGSDNLGSADITNLMATVKAAYSTGNVSTPAVQAIVSASGAELINIGNGLVKNSLGGGASVGGNQNGNGGGSVLPDANISLLLHGDNVLNPTAFLDSSAIEKEIVANGDVQQIGKFSGVGYFDGAGDYLSISDDSDFDFGSSDVTIDFWVKMSSLSGNPVFFGQSVDGILGVKNDHYAYFDTVGGTIHWAAKMEAANAEWITNTSLTAGVWTHIGLIKSGSNLYISKNGTITDTTTTTGMPSGIAAPFTIGKGYNIGHLNGFIDEFRISKGIARYTSTIQPPTSPYSSDGSDKLLVHFDGNGNAFADSSTSNTKTITPTGNATQITPKFGNGAMFFDGSGDYLGLEDSNSFDLGLSGEPFTIDFWIKSSSTSNQIFLNRGGGFPGWNGTSGHEYAFGQFLGNTYFQAWNGGALVNIMITGDVFSDGNFNHAAVSYDGTTVRVFKNGIIVGTSTDMTFAKPSGTTLTRIGESVSSDGFNMNGLLDEFRISKGIARWTSNFTPPTSPY